MTYAKMSVSRETKKKTNDRIVWTANQEIALIDLWEEKIADLRGARKNSHIYQEIAASLEEAGFMGSWSDVRTKLDNLTRKYKNEKAKIGPTGGSPSSWEYYHRVNNILGSFKIHNVGDSMCESTDLSSLLDDVIEFDPDSSCCSFQPSESDTCQKPPLKKRKKVTANDELVQLARERNEMAMKIHEERSGQLNQMLCKLDSMASQNAAFQKELLSILRGKK